MRLINIKKPGADIRDYYVINLETGFILALTALIILFRMDLEVKTEFVITHAEQEIIEMEEIVQTEQIQRPPPPPRPPAPIAVPDDEIADDVFFDLSTDFEIDALMDLPLAPPPMPDDSAGEEFDIEEIFTIVEDMPVLKGGMNAIYDNLQYPELARLAGIEGRVIIQFVIDENGVVSDPIIVRSIGGGCDEAAIEAVRKLEFIPGRQRGRAVKVRFSLPIVFRLT